MVASARELDLLTTPYVLNTDDARAMTQAGGDVLVAHMGLTTSGSIGAKTAPSLEECGPVINGIVDSAGLVRNDVVVMCHGGPIAEPGDSAYMLCECDGVNGFYGANSMERLSVERASNAQLEAFPTSTSSCRWIKTSSFPPRGLRKARPRSRFLRRWEIAPAPYPAARADRGRRKRRDQVRSARRPWRGGRMHGSPPADLGGSAIVLPLRRARDQ